jgi:FtsP/CotA-like multicopper oxidase with cupredoxin domain
LEVTAAESTVTVPHVVTQPGHRPPVTAIDSSEPLPPLESALQARFLAYDTLKKTATFQLAAEDELSGQLSFNGVRRGGRTLTIPLGWRLVIEFTNRDDKLPHSAVIVESALPVPDPLPPPAFLRAQTIKVDQGLLEGETDEITFVADRDGQYLMACGVLGHAQGGQWITLIVSANATSPNYR